MALNQNYRKNAVKPALQSFWGTGKPDMPWKPGVLQQLFSMQKHGKAGWTRHDQVYQTFYQALGARVVNWR